jgi:hypothetical protein
MTTAILEKEVQQRESTWPELRQPPQGGWRVPIVLRKGERIRMPRGFTCCLATSPPATAWPRIMTAVEEFGVRNLYIYAPLKAFLTNTKADPLIIAERNDKLYLIAAWE